MLVFQASTIISGQSVKISATYSSRNIAVIEFTVNKRHEREEKNNKIAITKWLIEQWAYCLAHLQSEGLTPTCTPYLGDGMGYYRYKVYRKLGFRPVYGLGLVWGEYSPEDLDLEDCPPLPRYLRNYYVEWQSYDHDYKFWTGLIFTDEREGTWEYCPKFIDEENSTGWKISWKPTPIDWEYWEELALSKGYSIDCTLYKEEKPELGIAIIMAEWWEQRGGFSEQRILKRLGVHDYYS